MKTYSGYFLAAPGGTLPSDDFLLNQQIVMTVNISYIGSNLPSDIWTSFEITSTKPLSDEPEPDEDSSVVYKYHLILARSKTRLILLADARDVAKFILREILSHSFYPNLRQIYVNTDAFVRECESPESNYLISVLYGRYSGDSHNVNKISLFGEDVTRSTAYQNQKELFTFYSCSIKKRKYPSPPEHKYGGYVDDYSPEVMRLSNDGFLSGNVSSKEHAKRITEAFKFIVEKKFVDNWVLDLDDG